MKHGSYALSHVLAALADNHYALAAYHSLALKAWIKQGGGDVLISSESMLRLCDVLEKEAKKKTALPLIDKLSGKGVQDV